MDPTTGKEIVEYSEPPDRDAVPGPLRQVEVTAYRTDQKIHTAIFAIPASFDNADVNAYLERTFDYVGFWEVFDQERRFCIRTKWNVVEGPDEPERGYEWVER